MAMRFANTERANEPDTKPTPAATTIMPYPNRPKCSARCANTTSWESAVSVSVEMMAVKPNNTVKSALPCKNYRAHLQSMHTSSHGSAAESFQCSSDLPRAMLRVLHCDPLICLPRYTICPTCCA